MLVGTETETKLRVRVAVGGVTGAGAAGGGCVAAVGEVGDDDALPPQPARATTRIAKHANYRRTITLPSFQGPPQNFREYKKPIYQPQTGVCGTTVTAKTIEMPNRAVRRELRGSYFELRK